MKLERRLVEKPWGVTRLPPAFGDTGGARIGEVWFTGAGELPLLAKYIFTSERLSIQNHPPDRGALRGKEECWFVLDAEPGATIGLGWKRTVSRYEARAAALDGSIVELIDWTQARAGDFISVALRRRTESQSDQPQDQRRRTIEQGRSLSALDRRALDLEGIQQRRLVVMDGHAAPYVALKASTTGRLAARMEGSRPPSSATAPAQITPNPNWAGETER